MATVVLLDEEDWVKKYLGLGIIYVVVLFSIIYPLFRTNPEYIPFNLWLQIIAGVLIAIVANFMRGGRFEAALHILIAIFYAGLFFAYVIIHYRINYFFFGDFSGYDAADPIVGFSIVVLCVIPIYIGFILMGPVEKMFQWILGFFMQKSKN